MRTIVIAAAMSLCVLSLASVASADTLILRNGARIEGTVVGIAGRTVTFKHADGVSHRYPTSQIASLEFFSADRANPRFVGGRTVEQPVCPELVGRRVDAIDPRTFGPVNLGAEQ